MKITATKDTIFKGIGFQNISLQEEVEERYAVLTKYIGLALSLAFLFFSIIGIYEVLNNGVPYTIDEITDHLMMVNGMLIFFLVRNGKTYLAKWLLLFFTPIFLFVIPSMDGIANYNSVFWFPYGLIAISILPLMICK